MVSYEQLAVIGCGLMGGSVALALKKAGRVKRVVGYSKSPSTTERAMQLGVIDEAAESALRAVAGADLVVLAVPVAATEATLSAIRHAIKPGMLLMDVGSTKGEVVQSAGRALGERMDCFVPAHPIAGKEVAGVEHAEADLYQGRMVILTPQAQTPAALVQRATDTWAAMGAQVYTMTTANHDAAFAAVSHLPHLLAFAYLQGVLDQPNGADFLSVAGSGFRDFTRIAASDRHVWRDILLSNRDDVLRQLQHFQAALKNLEAAVAHSDGPALERTIEAVARARAAWQPAELRRGGSSR